MKLTLNLASRTYVNRRALSLLYAVLIGILVLLLALNLSLFIRSQRHSARIRAHMAELDRELGQLRAEAGGDVAPEQLQELLVEISFANEILDKDSFRWTDLLNRLEELTFEGVTIRSLQPDYKQGSLKISGLAQDVGDLRRFMDRLFKSPYFKDVFLLQQGGAKVKDNLGRERQAIEFGIVLKGAF